MTSPTTDEPIVAVRRGRRNKNLLIVERCPFCERQHTHGAAGIPPAPGHRHLRLSHCGGTKARPYTLEEIA